MEKRTPTKSPPVIDSKHLGCMPGFTGLFDFHHPRPLTTQKLLLNANKTLTGAEQSRSKAGIFNSSNENHQRINKKHKKAKSDARIILDDTSQEMLSELSSHDKGFCNQIPLKHAKHSSSRTTKHYQVEQNSLQLVRTFKDQAEVANQTREKSLWKWFVQSRYMYPNKGKQNLGPSKSLEFSKSEKQNLLKERARKNKKSEPTDLKLSIRHERSTTSNPKRKESDIFEEARKHLSERLRKVEMLEAVSSRQTPRTLEGILLSSPKHELMDVLSSKWEKNNISVSMQMRFSPYGNSQLGYERSLQTREGKRTFKLDDPFMTCDSSSRGYMKILETPQESTSENQFSRFSPDLSSSSTVNICKLQIASRDQDREENPSPVSILDPFFMDDAGSPTSTITESEEPPLRPLYLNFDEHPEINLSTEMMDSETIYGYIKKVYQSSQLDWEEFLVQGWPSESSCDQKLLYDCIKEVLVNLHQCYFSSFIKSGNRAVPVEENVVNIMMNEVEWYTIPRTEPQTLDQIMAKDIAESGKWIDGRADTDDIVIEIVEEALEYAILEMIVDIQTIHSAHFKGLVLQL